MPAQMARGDVDVLGFSIKGKDYDVHSQVMARIRSGML
jgi:hypothetical protein